MPQIINENPNFGSLLGTGLASSLNVLAQNKLNQFAGRHQRMMTAQGLSALGIPEQDALQIAGLPEKLQGLALQSFLKRAEEGALQGLEQQPGMDQFYQQAAPQQNPQLAALQNLIAGQPMSPEQFSQQLSAQQPAPVSPAPAAAAVEAKARDTKGVVPTYNEPQQKIKRDASLAAILRAPTGISEKQKLIDKETKPIYDEVSKGARAAQGNNKRLDRMEELIKEGKLNSAAWVGFLDNAGGVAASIGGLLGLVFGGGLVGAGVGSAAGKAVGTGIGGLGNALLTPQSQEFNKLSNDFLKDAKDTFGSRLTNYDVQTFLATVPTLSQTDEGKKRVITNLRSFNEAAILRKKAMDQIIKDNNGRRPANLDTLIEERIAPQLDRLSEKFKKGEAL